MTHALVVEQVVPASPARVWAAWASASELARWWWPHLPDTRYEVDLRPGGGYRIESASAGIGVHGEFLAVDEPRLVVMTWVWLDGGEPQATERVEVHFSEHLEGATKVTVKHEVAGTDEAVAAYESGWKAVLNRLAIPEPYDAAFPTS